MYDKIYLNSLYVSLGPGGTKDGPSLQTVFWDQNMEFYTPHTPKPVFCAIGTVTIPIIYMTSTIVVDGKKYRVIYEENVDKTVEKKIGVWLEWGCLKTQEISEQGDPQDTLGQGIFESRGEKEWHTFLTLNPISSTKGTIRS